MKKSNFSVGEICWASEHDWYIGVNANGNIVCREEWPDGVGGVVVHTSYQELRDWAGY